MAPSREILTLQLGHYANYVGTHWWNSQVRIFCAVTCILITIFSRSVVLKIVFTPNIELNLSCMCCKLIYLVSKMSLFLTGSWFQLFGQTL